VKPVFLKKNILGAPWIASRLKLVLVEAEMSFIDSFTPKASLKKSIWHS